MWNNAQPNPGHDQQLVEQLLHEMRHAIATNQFDSAINYLTDLCNRVDMHDDVAVDVRNTNKAGFLGDFVTTVLTEGRYSIFQQIQASDFWNLVHHMDDITIDAIRDIFIQVFEEINPGDINFDVNLNHMPDLFRLCVAIVAVPKFTVAIKDTLVGEVENLSLNYGNAEAQRRHEFWQRFANEYIAPNIQVVNGEAHGDIVLPPLVFLHYA